MSRQGAHLPGPELGTLKISRATIPDFGEGTATMSDPLSTETMTIDALIADDFSERGYGLMYRPRMRADLGMAFIFESQAKHRRLLDEEHAHSFVDRVHR